MELALLGVGLVVGFGCGVIAAFVWIAYCVLPAP